MKFSVSKRTLHSTLQKVIKVTPIRSTLPILSCILFTLKDKTLELISTDLEITMVTGCPVNTETEGAIAIPGRMLLEVTSELPDTDLHFDIDSEKDRITISTSLGGEYVIMGRPATEFPSIPMIDKSAKFTFNSLKLNRIIDKTIFAVSRDEMKASLNGVLFQFKENEFRAVSTDGHRLVRYVLNDFENTDFISDVIIPFKFLTLLSTNLRGETDVDFRIGKNHVFADFGDMTIYSRIIEERFPDYDSVIPMNNKHILKAKIDDLVSSVKRISIFSSKTTHQIVLGLSENNLALSTEDIETSSTAKELLDVNYSGDEFLISLNADYLKDIIRHIDGENVEVHMNSALSASLFFPEEQEPGEDLLMLLMPIRTS